MYFKNRADAGRALAAKISKYNDEQCVVLALNDGGVIVGAQIALKIHANLMVLISNKVMLPGEPDPLASMTTSTFTYNPMYSEGERDELTSEFRGVIDAQRLENFHKINALVSDGAEIDPKDLRHHVIILVADALHDAMMLNVAYDFLKRIEVKRLIIATPLANVTAVDAMHLMGDEIYCLSVADNLMIADHYYDDNIVPDHAGIMKIIRNLSFSWSYKTVDSST